MDGSTAHLQRVKKFLDKEIYTKNLATTDIRILNTVEDFFNAKIETSLSLT